MNYDTKVPITLKREQQWFGAIIGSPINEESKLSPFSPSGQPIEIEAAQHITPSPTLKPVERIQIYHQQYWWRLLDTLHDSFPLLTRLFGYDNFNRTIGIPYLLKYPPNSWTLNVLGDRIPQWIVEEYHAPDKELVLDVANLDRAFSHSFLASQLPPITAEQLSFKNDMDENINKVLFLQPSVHLFDLRYDLFKFREDFLLHDPDFWLDKSFPKLNRDKTYYHILYRNQRNDIYWKEVTLGEFKLLRLFQQGSSIEKACEWVEKLDSHLYEEAVSNMHSWFQQWTMDGWLSLEKANYHLSTYL